MTLLTDAHAIAADLVDIRRRVHRHPEIGMLLPVTQQLILDELAPLGLEISVGSGLSSVTAVLAGGTPGPTVLLRTEMDALPVLEASGEEFSSEIDGAMHACGHDLHIAAILGAARLLADRRESLTGNVVFMFQPGEESPGGALPMIEEGVLGAAPTPVVAAYGFHVMASGTTVPPRAFGSRPGTLMAATDGYAITVTGRGGHGSMPHLAADPIVAAAQIVTTLQTMVTRTLGPFEPAVITVGSIHGGTAENIIPDQVVLGATLRTFDVDVRSRAIDGIRRVCEGIAAANGVTVEIEVDQGYPATVNDAAAVERASGIVAELLGADRWYDMPAPMPGGEDFSYVLERVPGAFLMLGAQPAGVPAGDAAFNHSAAARFDDSLVPDAAAVLAALALDHLA